MKFADHLSRADIQKFNNIKRAAKNKKEHKTKKNKLEDGHRPNAIIIDENVEPAKRKMKEKVNWVDIMGINRDIYTRRNGAVRRK